MAFHENYQYHSIIKKCISIFGSIFNDIQVTRENAPNSQTQSFIVPLAYGPREKFLARLDGDPNIAMPIATFLPRMSFEIKSFLYDNGRKLGDTKSIVDKSITQTGALVTTVGSPIPYNLGFELCVMTHSAEDGMEIIEQILPYFSPDFSVTVSLLEQFPSLKTNMAIVLNNVAQSDDYANSFKIRRTLIWTLDFTMRALFYGPISNDALIKFVSVNLYSDFMQSAFEESVTVQPSITANGQPTSNTQLSIPYSDISSNSNYEIVTTLSNTQVLK